MKITPIEIRQHTFEKAMRGYKPEDVDAFLISLSQEWERVNMDFKMLKMQLEIAEKELGKLKEVEMTLFRTLKTAEDTSNQITDQANKAADIYLTEAKQKADDLLADARKRSTLMVQDAENQARYLKDNILNDLKSLEHDFKALEQYKENLGVQIRDLAGKAIDSVDRFEKKFARQNLLGKIDEVATQITDELKQADAAKKPDYEAASGTEAAMTPVAPTSADAAPADTAPAETVSAEPAPVEVEPVADHTPAPELPPLIEREASIPEAIPVHTIDVPAPAPEPAEPVAQTPAEPHTPVSTLAETMTAAPEPAPAPTPQPVGPPEETQPKRGGSFFDQI